MESEPEKQPVTKSESLRQSIKKKLRRSFRKLERKSSTTSQNSNEEAEVTTTKDWYHYSQQTPDYELFERLKADEDEFGDHEGEGEEENLDLDSASISAFQMEPHVKEVLRQSWKQLQEQISSLGNVTFLSLFYVQPETLDTYLSAEDIEALKQSDQEKLFVEKLRVHPLRIMSVVEKTMHRLEDHQRCLKMLKLFGRQNQRHGIHPEMFQYMAKSFISVIDQTLSEIDAWNSEVSLAWEQLFQWITFGLGKGFVQANPADTAMVPTAITSTAKECTAQE